MKVYIVELYEYGIPHRIGMTTNKEEAKQILKEYSAFVWSCVKVYDLIENQWVDFEDDYEDCIDWND